MPLYLVSFTSGPPLHVNAPDPDAAKAHAAAVMTLRHNGEEVSLRGVPVSADQVKA